MMSVSERIASVLFRSILVIRQTLKPKANGRHKTQNEKHETKRFSTYMVYRLRHAETINVSQNVFSEIKQCLIRGTCAKKV